MELRLLARSLIQLVLFSQSATLVIYKTLSLLVSICNASASEAGDAALLLGVVAPSYPSW